ncbi:DUF1178 family protein [Comamonas kerstersii]|uniref:DUF1178 family protein n=1 Tax=Comamonas kerstersii TaxID=225992 RepID=A0A6A1R3U1_9BURK|nr:DUF1178 family protein [Comamonas kerstersii]KAB0587068.1 DUF1178 family protein [Comamonas kerstersii]
MKVFDLHCPLDHVFEGWFASEEDFRSQLDRGLVECPMCGSKELRKGLSAPRLNLGAQPAAAAPAPVPDEADRRKLHALQAAWLEVSRKIATKTEDVGERFAEEALRMHKGEEPERPIRGQATPQQAMELLEEGVPVMPLALPKSSKETLQ